jgi:hypothetical protein
LAGAPVVAVDSGPDRKLTCALFRRGYSALRLAGRTTCREGRIKEPIAADFWAS